LATAEIIEGYCDESGIQDGASNCVVAGWVATSRKWKLFESRWSRASGGVEFHGKQFFARDPGGNRVGPYRGWPDDRANKYLQGLLDAILDCQLRSIGAVINVADFQARTVEERKWLTGAAYLPDFKKWEGRGSPQRPYYLGFTECVEQGAACVKIRTGKSTSISISKMSWRHMPLITTKGREATHRRPWRDALAN